MKKTYKTPAMKVSTIQCSQMVCESPEYMEFDEYMEFNESLGDGYEDAYAW